MKELPVAALFRFLIPASVIAIGLVLSIMLDPLKAWIFIAVAMAASFLIPNPKRLITFYFLWVLLGGIMMDSKLYLGWSIPGIRYIDEFITATITLCLCGQMTMVRRLRSELSPLIFCLLFLLGVIGLSAYVNGSSKFIVFKFVSSYVGFVPILLLMLEYTPRPPSRSIVRLLVALLLLQLALNIGWYFGFNPIINYDLGGPDFAHGTLGGCNFVAYFSVFMILLCVSRLLEHRRVPGFGRGLAVFVAAVAFIQLLFTFTMHALFLLILVGGLQLLLGVRLRYLQAQRLIILVILGITGGGLALLVVSIAGVGEAIFTFFDPQVLALRVHALMTGPTANIYRNVMIDIWHEVPVPLLGAGPGGFGSSVAIEYGAPLTRKYIWVYYLTTSGRDMIRGSSITQSLISGVSALWGDLGPFGTFLYFGLFIIPARRVWRNLAGALYQDPFQRVLSRVYMPYLTMLLLIILLQDTFWNDVVQCSVIFLNAYLWDPIATAAPAAPDDKSASPRAASSRPVPRFLPVGRRGT